MTAEDRELRELARRTDGLRPHRGFTEAVMAAVEAADVEPPVRSLRLGDGVARSGAVAVVLAAVAAAACVFVSLSAQSSFDEQVVLSVDTLSVDTLEVGE